MGLSQPAWAAATLGCTIPMAIYLVIALIITARYSSIYVGLTWGPAFIVWLLGKLPYRW